jgi:hypothetical protein
MMPENSPRWPICRDERLSEANWYFSCTKKTLHTQI